MNKFIIFVLSAMLLAATFDSAFAGDKGGDIIVLGGGGGGGDGGFGGGQPTVIKSGGKKGGSVIYIGRKRRSIEQPREPVVTIYRPFNQRK